MELLNVDNNAKTVKGNKYGYRTAILYMAPAELSGKNLCSYSTPGCRAACLNTAGMGVFNKVQNARIRKAQWFNEDRKGFMGQLAEEIYKFATKAERDGVTPVVRLNGTTDIMWERIPIGGCKNLMDMFNTVQFYDYTKIPVRYRLSRIPDNYHLTFSLAENNDSHAREALDAGVNVAAVFHNIPERYMNRPVINGDEHDLRFKTNGVIVGLKAKGKARHDNTGFVR